MAGDLTDSSMGRTHYGIVRTDSSMAIHSLAYGGAVRNFPSLPIPISAMTVLQHYSCEYISLIDRYVEVAGY